MASAAYAGLSQWTKSSGLRVRRGRMPCRPLPCSALVSNTGGMSKLVSWLGSRLSGLVDALLALWLTTQGRREVDALRDALGSFVTVVGCVALVGLVVVLTCLLWTRGSGPVSAL